MHEGVYQNLKFVCFLVSSGIALHGILDRDGGEFYM